ncbi:hypothetical protein [Chenggangzhangella methanolivorans]|uniref:Uncharacterized protein n=1 Tax=Chenggangzhangella methanolivorans TaxID=1437009 RepID=A0A9E6UM19_9HYPH|nr:hypothetical protein [Chenggangzhangella methanolivorans]QZN99595.1 hypothetical protein K6K41_23325 [Chenggangzhangella methanolivorans]
MTIDKPRKAVAIALAGAMGLAMLVPTSAEAGRRNWRGHHHHGGGGAAAAAVGIGVLGVLAATAAANADRECWYEKRRFETASGKIVIRKVKVCD